SQTNLGVKITLEKHIPAAAGVGGGSADAAATLRALCRLWGLDLSQEELEVLALSLGADIPVCLRSTACLMRGVGEDLLEVLHTPKLGILLVNPGVSVPTPAIFGAREAGFSDIPNRDLLYSTYSDAQFLDYLRDQQNDLYDPACRLNPIIADVVKAIGDLPHIRLARMSGSGATCFGIFDNLEAAKQAKSVLLSQFPKWWSCATELI
ncbi:MAG: 4-(cytidine 5'-diphospho)-2-C-methyl-D-erythritol kinase, partial [Alphaproteobacteria bacterium]|nr:4-(cytidine 5'-diphospho)-2-C-methyl-D-erythritol kinase [Alphaproteobacteria bacterium]